MQVLGEVLRVLQEARIDVLPVKGIVTAHALYEDVADRPMGDIDLRLRKRDFSRALEAARAMGWETFEYTPRFWDGGIRLKEWEVEIECTIGPPGLCETSIDELMERAWLRDEPFGFPHLEPELNDHALMLCANAFKDVLRPTPWALEDLRRIASRGDFDPRLVASRARRGRMATAVWIVADWLATEHSIDPWTEVRDRIGRVPPRPYFALAFTRFARRRNPSSRIGLLLMASAGDGVAAATRGFALGACGAVRGAILRRAR